MVRALAARNVTAIFAGGNQSYATDMEGRLCCFGDGYGSDSSKEPVILREFNFQDLALADGVPFAMVKESDGNFALVKLGSVTSRVEVDCQIVKFHSMKTGGDHVGIKVFIPDTKP